MTIQERQKKPGIFLPESYKIIFNAYFCARLFWKDELRQGAQEIMPYN